jgi:hypothetical protein
MQVKWNNYALDTLADIYVAASQSDKFAIGQTVEFINRQLADDPAELGESRSGGRRLWFVPPLAVHYRIGAAGVVVLEVKRHPRSR